jgi:hypothetical protein
MASKKAKRRRFNAARDDDEDGRPTSPQKGPPTARRGGRSRPLVALPLLASSL